jgi:hypothetical protein
MGLIVNLVALGFGVGLGVLLAPSFATIESYRQYMMKKAFRQEPAWTLHQRGDGYELIPLDFDDDISAWVAHEDSDDDKLVFEDTSLMSELFGKPFGISVSGSGVIGDAGTAVVGDEVGSKENHDQEIDIADEATADEDDPDGWGFGDETMADGGTVTLETESLKDRLLAGRVGTANGYQIQYINPFVTVPRDEQLVDARGLTKLLRHSGGPKTPVKAAETRAIAENKLKDSGTWDKLINNGSLIAAFLMGAITVEYIAGGGGGGVSVGLFLAPML